MNSTHTPLPIPSPQRGKGVVVVCKQKNLGSKSTLKKIDYSLATWGEG